VLANKILTEVRQLLIAGFLKIKEAQVMVFSFKLAKTERVALLKVHKFHEMIECTLLLLFVRHDLQKLIKIVHYEALQYTNSFVDSLVGHSC